jgi:predicted DNA binding CopG/RHH family protein
MKKTTLRRTKEERELDAAIERGEYVSVDNLASLKARYAKVAKDTFAKQKTVNVRISERNLLRLKAAAARQGVSYQTFITSLIQEHVTER